MCHKMPERRTAGWQFKSKNKTRQLGNTWSALRILERKAEDRLIQIACFGNEDLRSPSAWPGWISFSRPNCHLLHNPKSVWSTYCRWVFSWRRVDLFSPRQFWFSIGILLVGVLTRSSDDSVWRRHHSFDECCRGSKIRLTNIETYLRSHKAKPKSEP